MSETESKYGEFNAWLKKHDADLERFVSDARPQQSESTPPCDEQFRMELAVSLFAGIVGMRIINLGDDVLRRLTVMTDSELSELLSPPGRELSEYDIIFYTVLYIYIYCILSCILYCTLYCVLFCINYFIVH